MTPVIDSVRTGGPGQLDSEKGGRGWGGGSGLSGSRLDLRSWGWGGGVGRGKWTVSMGGRGGKWPVSMAGGGSEGEDGVVVLGWVNTNDQQGGEGGTRSGGYDARTINTLQRNTNPPCVCV